MSWSRVKCFADLHDAPAHELEAVLRGDVGRPKFTRPRPRSMLTEALKGATPSRLTDAIRRATPSLLTQALKRQSNAPHPPPAAAPPKPPVERAALPPLATERAAPPLPPTESSAPALQRLSPATPPRIAPRMARSQPITIPTLRRR